MSELSHMVILDPKSLMDKCRSASAYLGLAWCSHHISFQCKALLWRQKSLGLRERLCIFPNAA